MGAKGMKALFFNGFHIYIYMWQKGGKSPLSFWKQQPRKQFFASILLQFCFPAFYAAVTATTWAVFSLHNVATALHGS